MTLRQWLITVHGYKTIIENMWICVLVLILTYLAASTGWEHGYREGKALWQQQAHEAEAARFECAEERSALMSANVKLEQTIERLRKKLNGAPRHQGGK